MLFFYETNEPYFSLIRAESAERAIEIYNHMFGSKPHELIEKSRHEALSLFLANEFGDSEGLINEFNHRQDQEAVLLVDRGLI